MKHAITVAADHIASMKLTLNMPFNLLRDVRRWLQTFNVNLASEGNTRKVMNDYIGNGLRAEEIPAFVMKGKKMITAIKPWCYLFNLVGYVIKFLSDLDETRQLCDHPFIPDNEIHLKIGGDHGGGSFKMSFQIGNVYSPNKPQNTVIFSIMEAKDYKSNLHLCLERFKAHISKFNKIRWQQKTFRIFLFGDYEFLCKMYGISGASGKHPCLWCHNNMCIMCSKDYKTWYVQVTYIANLT